MESVLLEDVKCIIFREIEDGNTIYNLGISNLDNISIYSEFGFSSETEVLNHLDGFRNNYNIVEIVIE
jgi:hypothetical protein